MRKKAFSLIELILVIILIGATYSLVLGKLNKKKNININKLENLKTILKNKMGDELIVFNGCKNAIFKNSSTDIDSSIFKDIEVFNVKDETMQRVDFTPIIIKDEIYDVCLRFKIFKNGSTSSFIIKKDEKYIVFYPYFRDSEVFKSSQEAINALSGSNIKDELKDEI